MHRYLIIIGGGHYSKNGFYEKIKEICAKNANVSIFISSHKNKNKIDKDVLNIINSIKNCRFRYFENLGFDWGMYSQAVRHLGSSILNYDYICFMHDDIDIVNSDFLPIFSDFIEKNNLVVAGNGQAQVLHPWPKTHPHIIEWGKLSKWKMDIKSKAWSTVRGSFFVAKKCVFNKIKRIPFKSGADIRFGNWPLIIFGGLVSDVFGTNSISSISKDRLYSPYIIECERGSKVNKRDLKKRQFPFISKIKWIYRLYCAIIRRRQTINLNNIPELKSLPINLNKVKMITGGVFTIGKYVIKISDKHHTFLLKNERDCLTRLSKYNNFPKVIKFIQSKDKSYLIMSKLEGADLARKFLLTKKEMRILRMELDKILNILKKENMIHRDIRPHNLILSNQKVYLIDFQFAILNQREVKTNNLQEKITLELCKKNLSGKWGVQGCSLAKTDFLTSKNVIKEYKLRLNFLKRIKEYPYFLKQKMNRYITYK